MNITLVWPKNILSRNVWIWGHVWQIPWCGNHGDVHNLDVSIVSSKEAKGSPPQVNNIAAGSIGSMTLWIDQLSALLSLFSLQASRPVAAPLVSLGRSARERCATITVWMGAPATWARVTSQCASAWRNTPETDVFTVSGQNPLLLPRWLLQCCI